jgi:GT2 family glycosyltransferase/tetratricopeptide (TPR) repeat protein
MAFRNRIFSILCHWLGGRRSQSELLDEAHGLSKTIPSLISPQETGLHRGDETVDSKGLFERILRTADLARDRGLKELAAEFYARAAELRPERDDIRVQLGNMLKDAGRFAEAEVAYRGALTVAPDVADTHLQLARNQRAAGKGTDALRSYVRALEIEPALAVALAELASLGDILEMRAVSGRLGPRLITDILDMAADLKRGIAAIEAELPVLRSLAAIPIERYDLFRRDYIVPPAPASIRRIGVVMLGDAKLAGLLAVLHGLQVQSYEAFTVVMPDLGGESQVAFARLAAAQPLRYRMIPPQERVVHGTVAALEHAIEWLGPHDITVVAQTPVVLEREALGWMSAAFDGSSVVSCIPDEDALDLCGEMPTFREPLLHGAFDPEIAEQGVDCCSVFAARSVDLHAAVCDLPQDAPFRTGETLLRLNRIAPPGPLGRTLASTVVPRPPTLSTQSSTDLTAAQEMASLAVVVLTRDHLDMLQSAVEAFQATVVMPERCSLILVDNGSRDASTLDYLKDGVAQGTFRVLRVEEPFNWSRLNNLAAASTEADLLVFMNNDVELISPGWDRQVRAVLGRRDVGVVGARLIYPDRTIQHAGIVLGFGVGGEHEGRGLPAEAPGPGGRFQTRHCVSAVTGAFLATRHETFKTIGGFDELRLPLWFNDVDYCLKTWEIDLRVLYEPAILAIHHESKTLAGAFDSKQRNAYFTAARQIMIERWGERMVVDPWVSGRYAKANGLRAIVR